jgi:enterochelin esterase family protein
MKIKLAILALSLGLTRQFCMAQPAASAALDDFKPASSNVPGQQYPRINSELRAMFRVNAPGATNVSVSLGRPLQVVRGGDGVWTITTPPLAPGFHYYSLIIDGVSVADPASESYFGTGKMSSGLEVPSKGEDFYEPKNVPHGEVRARWYFSKTTGATRHAYVYTPPDYDTQRSSRYPVLYLQHGMGEDVRGWSTQGRANFILDNLIAAGQARPMIIVMDDGGIAAGMGGGGRGGGGRRGAPPVQTASPGASAAGPGTNNASGAGGNPGGRRGGMGGGPGGLGSEFDPILISDIIPMIDATYRTIPDRDHRAMAGLSLGGTQTWGITQAHLDHFAYIGSFSAPFGYPAVPGGFNGLFGDPAAFAKQVKVLFISCGNDGDLGAGGSRTLHQALEKAGIQHVYYESLGTAHEWQTWRRSLQQFAPLLFNKSPAALDQKSKKTK